MWGFIWCVTPGRKPIPDGTQAGTSLWVTHLLFHFPALPLKCSDQHKRWFCKIQRRTTWSPDCSWATVKALQRSYHNTCQREVRLAIVMQVQFPLSWPGEFITTCDHALLSRRLSRTSPGTQFCETWKSSYPRQIIQMKTPNGGILQFKRPTLCPGK